MTLLYGHIPILVYDEILDMSKPYYIDDSQTSHAYYGILRGSPNYYMINEPSDFDFFVQILTPENFPDKSFTIEIIGENSDILLDGNTYAWKHFYEEYVGDDYLEGPKLENRLTRGKYFIKISNKNNTGRYILAVGKKEKFTIYDSLHTLIVLPKLKTEFFNKSLPYIFSGKIGNFILILLIIFIVIIIYVLS